MIQRHITSFIKTLAREYPVLFITGPRQSGKTTLVKSLFPKLPYLLLEDAEEREFASTDPRGFLDRLKQGAILDEVQRAPDLISSLMGVVDENPKKKFILTGSQNLLLNHKISQSLAGRVGIAHLMPLTLEELKKARQLRTPAEKALFTGGYPRIYDKNLDAHRWYKNYYHTYLERDVRTLTNIGDLYAFQCFMRLCAARSGQLLNLSSLATDAGISQPTAKSWLSVLEASFLITLLLPHYRNFNKRLIKSPKLYFLDTGLLCYLLKIDTPEMLQTHAMRGPVFETFIVSELFKMFHHRGKVPPLFFWRDHTGHEIDILLESRERLIPLEIKSGQTIASDALSGINYWCHLPKNDQKTGYLIYAGQKSYTRQGVHVLPWDEADTILTLTD